MLMGTQIPSLTIIFIISVPSPRFFHTPGIAHIHFPPYTRDELLKIVSLTPPNIFPDGWDPNIGYTEEQAAEDNAYVWGRFCSVVWDTLGKGAARDLLSFRKICHKLWKPFTSPIVDGTFGTRDFARLVITQRAIFQDESVLLHNAMHVTRSKPDANTSVIPTRITHDLPYYSGYILCAAYLASYNPAKSDPTFFMHSHEKKKKKRATGASAGKPSKQRRIPRSMLAPSPFSLDRMLAVLHAILPHSLPQSADILTQISTLASLRLLVRAGAGREGAIDAGSRWKVNCRWEFVAELARSTGLEIRDYVASALD
jgi:origin recognition complex subunit 5